MTKNPLYNAVLAELYILLVVLVMHFGTRSVGPKDSFLDPIALISLFTLSAAVMGYIFLSKPLELYFIEQKKEAVKLFLQTVLAFGIITIIALVAVFSGIFR